MNESEAKIVFCASASLSRGGRKKKFIRVEVKGGELALLNVNRTTAAQLQPQQYPPLIKLSNLARLLGVSRASVYRMTKMGLKTVRPTNGDQHVRREDLKTFLQARETAEKRRH
jgi:hypothetical protein